MSNPATPPAALRLMASRSLFELMNDWDATEDNTAEEIPMVRGWLMEEMERRNLEAFENWMLGPATIGPRQYFIPA